MKRRQLIKHRELHDCTLLREGSGHSVDANTKSGKRTAVPRHIEIDDLLARKICRQLAIPVIGSLDKNQ